MDIGLPVLVVSAAPNVQIQIGYHVKYVEALSQLFESCFYHSVRGLYAGEQMRSVVCV